MYNDNSKKGYAAGILYTICAILPVIIAFVFLMIIESLPNSAEIKTQNSYIYLGFLISQISFLIALVFIKLKYKTKLSSGFKKFKIRYLFLALALSFGLMFGLSFVNAWFVDLLKKIGLNAPTVSVPDLSNTGGYLLSLFVIAVLPSILEEIVFREVLLGELSGGGTVFAVLVCGALFSLFHQNPSQTLYQFITGAVFALMTIKAGSIIPAVIMHFANNAYILTAYKFFPNYTAKPIITIFAIVIAVVATIYLCLVKNQPKHKTKNTAFFMYALPGIVLCLVMWITGLFV